MLAQVSFREGVEAMKKMILFIVDSLHPVVLGRMLSEGNTPALKFLAEHGHYTERVVSSFPTMTPVATSSIMTGKWPDSHLVPGFIWYNEETGRMMDYGATWQSVLKQGPEKVVRNLLQRLNQEHLNRETPTVHERLEDNGFVTGNINFFIHRASELYQAKVPNLIAWATRLRLYKEKVFGPKLLVLGELIHPPLKGGPFSFPKGIFHRFGINDVFSGRIAAQIIREGKQPDFLVVYLPDNDKYSHQYGPLRSGPSLERVDQQIGLVLDALGSWEQALEDNVIIVTGDHSQTTVGLDNEYQIDLDRTLRMFKRLKITDKEPGDHEIAICPNERMAFIYLLQRPKQLLPEVAGILARDYRNAQVAWRDRKNRYVVVEGGTERKLIFSRRGPYRDSFGQSWNFSGDLSVIDAKVSAEGKLEYGKYPDAFARLISALEARRASRVVVSALSGYEYFGEGAPIHPGGGSHGSLEEEDSVVPMIVSGTEDDLDNPRIIDLYGLVMRHFRVQT